MCTSDHFLHISVNGRHFFIRMHPKDNSFCNRSLVSSAFVKGRVLYAYIGALLGDVFPFQERYPLFKLSTCPYVPLHILLEPSRNDILDNNGIITVIFAYT